MSGSHQRSERQSLCPWVVLSLWLHCQVCMRNLSFRRAARGNSKKFFKWPNQACQTIRASWTIGKETKPGWSGITRKVSSFKQHIINAIAFISDKSQKPGISRDRKLSHSSCKLAIFRCPALYSEAIWQTLFKIGLYLCNCLKSIISTFKTVENSGPECEKYLSHAVNRGS